jgi:hypothetical protein
MPAEPTCQDPAAVDYLDLVQWPAMVITVIAAWFTASRTKGRRGIGFWCFLGSNVLWVIWGWHSAAYALIVLQLCLAAMNIRGARKNDAM